MSMQTEIKLAKIAAGTLVMRALSKEASRKFLLNQLSEMPGIATKVQQQLDLLSPQATMPLNKGISADLAMELIRIGSPALAKEIVSLSESSAAASIGQVHQAILKDGRKIAVKVQYPDLISLLDEQLDFLVKAAKFATIGKQAINFEEYRSFLRARLIDETNYLAEAEKQKIFFSLYQNFSGIRIPEIIPEYCSPSVLTQEYIETISFDASKMAFDRGTITRSMADFLLCGIFGHGHVHADLHPGNWAIDAFGRLVIFDFGSTLELSATEILAFRRLYALAHGKSTDVSEYFSAFRNLGFSEPVLNAIHAKLPDLAELMLFPLIHKGANCFLEWNFSQRAKIILGEMRWSFRASGRPWFFQLMRAVSGALACFSRLNYFPELDGVIAMYEKKYPLSEFFQQPVAKHLRVQVHSEGDLIVDLKLPARAAENLQAIMPAETQNAIRNKGINLAEIEASIIQHGFAPQELFIAKLESKAIRVWLE